MSNCNYSDLDWSEDFNHDNGDYFHKCVDCGLHFRGHKRRVVCKVCSTAASKLTQIKVEEMQGEIVLTSNSEGELVCVSRQDEEGGILKVLWEAPINTIRCYSIPSAFAWYNTDTPDISHVSDMNISKYVEVRCDPKNEITLLYMKYKTSIGLN